MQYLKRILMAAVILSIAAALATVFTERQAIAQAVRAALVRNEDEPGRNPYSEQQGCFGAGCTVALTPVPAGRRLVLTNVNVEMGAPGGSPIFIGGHGAERWLFPTNQIGALQYASTQVRLYYEAGETPSIDCEGCGSDLMEVNASGYYVSLP